MNLSAIFVDQTGVGVRSAWVKTDGSWKQLSGEKSSKELVQVLLNEIQGTNDSVKNYFTGLVCYYSSPRSPPVVSFSFF